MADEMNMPEDYGLITPTAGDKLGKPGQVLGGESQLSRLLRETPSYGHTLKQFLTSPGGILGTLGGAGLSALLSGGNEGQAVGGFMQGLQQGIGQQFEDEVTAYKARVEAAKTAMEAQDKSRNRLVELMTARPEFFQDTGATPTQIGEIMAPGMGLAIDPVSNFNLKTKNAGNVDKAKAIFELMKQSQDPEASKTLATMYNNLMGLEMPAEVLQSFWENKGNLSWADKVRLFGAPAVTEYNNIQSAAMRGEPYEEDFSKYKYMPPKDDATITRLQEANMLAKKVNDVMVEATNSGSPIDLETAKKLALTPVEVKQLEALIPTMQPEININDYIKTFMQTLAPVATMLAMTQPGMFKDPQRVISEITAQRMDAANELSKQNKAQADIGVYSYFLAKVKVEHPEWSYEQQKTEAIGRTKAKGIIMKAAK